MRTTDTAEPTMSRDEMADDYLRLKREYTLLHEEYRRLQSEKKKQLKLSGVVKSLNADDLIATLGEAHLDNEYVIKPDERGEWWMTHKHVGSGEPLKQWLNGNT